MQTLIKIIWYVLRQARSFVKFLFFKIFQGSYFKKLGSGTKFFGKVRFGTIENNISIGKNCMIGHDVFFSAEKNAAIIIGDDCSLNTACHIVAIKSITIKSGTRIGEFCSVRDQNHSFDDLDKLIYQQGFEGKEILIEENCWIGRGVMITAGVTLEHGCIVGANSVVTKSFSSNSVIAGVPAKFIRTRGEKTQQ